MKYLRQNTLFSSHPIIMTLLKLIDPEKKEIPKCIWKNVTESINIGNEQLERCRTLCNGYNTKCDYYFTQRGKYDQ